MVCCGVFSAAVSCNLGNPSGRRTTKQRLFTWIHPMNSITNNVPSGGRKETHCSVHRARVKAVLEAVHFTGAKLLGLVCTVLYCTVVYFHQSFLSILTAWSYYAEQPLQHSINFYPFHQQLFGPQAKSSSPSAETLMHVPSLKQRTRQDETGATLNCSLPSNIFTLKVKIEIPSLWKRHKFCSKIASFGKNCFVKIEQIRVHTKGTTYRSMPEERDRQSLNGGCGRGTLNINSLERNFEEKLFVWPGTFLWSVLGGRA